MNRPIFFDSPPYGSYFTGFFKNEIDTAIRQNILKLLDKAGGHSH